ncbi:MAG: chemotaxis protein CheB [Solirubrobacterales bacterium]|nr:chemotaxis protein CheB [Solirubrobacterales bacterium]MBV9918734.1 chemotaxis protein CheB [Solirubrobacterales bacterium]
MPSLDPLTDFGNHRDLVVIGASAGGVEALKAVAEGLPGDLDAAVCVVLHIAPRSSSALAAILERAGPLPCRAAHDDGPLRSGEILVAPPDRHLVIEDGRARVTVGPRENGHRPAVDVLFRSAAGARRRRVVGVVLSGTRDDGAVGLASIKAAGGAAVVQSPTDAMYPGMPTSALANVVADAVVPLARMGQTIAAIVRGDDVSEGAGANQPPEDPERDERLTSVCPECGGVLTEESEAGTPYWECHVGHRYSPASFADAQANGVEAALWTAVRALRDRGAILEQLAKQSDARGQPRSARHFEQQADSARAQADVVRDALDVAAATALQQVPAADDDAGAEPTAPR